MSNQEEKKCEFCGGTGMIYKQNMDSEGKVTSYGYKCDCQFPKPSPSQSCEHDDGDVWINQMFAHHKKHHKTCPFCKPTAVEPLGNPDIGYGGVTLCSAVEPSVEEKIKEIEVSLEGNLKALEMRNDKIKSLESQLASANEKIVELEATQLSLDDICYRKLNSELEAELSTANKKAEKLVGLVESLSLLKHYRHKLDEKCTALCEWADEAKQAIKEFKGEK